MNSSILIKKTQSTFQFTNYVCMNLEKYGVKDAI